MTAFRKLIRAATWLALAVCTVRTAFLAFIAFVIPDPECFRLGVFDYAVAALCLYTVSLLTIMLRSTVNEGRAEAILLILSIAGAAGSYLVWALPQQRVRCDGTVLNVG